MSYDLTFTRPGGFSATDFATYFGAREHFTVEGTAARYEHPNTGVAFSFELHDPAIAFNLNYFRPRVFALEAAGELSALIARFSPAVDDPQGGGAFSTDAFFEGWNAGNEAAAGVHLLATKGQSNVRTLPRAALEAAWRWNFNRAALQAELGEMIFVPRLFLFDLRGVVQRAVVWTDGIAIAFPEVDAVLTHRDDFARQFMRQAQPSTSLATWAEVATFVGALPVRPAPAPFRVYAPEQLTDGLIRFFVDRPELQPHELTPLRTDEVLDEDLRNPP